MKKKTNDNNDNNNSSCHNNRMIKKAFLTSQNCFSSYASSVERQKESLAKSTYSKIKLD